MDDTPDDPAGPVPAVRPGWRRRVLRWLAGTAVVVAVLVLFLWNQIFVRINPGQVGVLYSLFFGGTVTSWTYSEGLTVKLPWDRIYILERRSQAPGVTVHALSREGLPIDLDAVLFFQMRPEQAPRVLSEMGTDYAARFLVPLVQGALREVVSRYNSHELYTHGYGALYADLVALLNNPDQPYRRFFTVQEIAIRQLDLPQAMVEAILRKLAAEQDAVAYRFRLEQQRQEAERLRIEAEGLQAYNRIVHESLTDRLLTLRGIEATVQIARSNNAKVVIVGGHKDQMPLILGGDLTASPPAAPAAPPEPAP